MSCINYSKYMMGNLLTNQQPSYRKCIRPMGLKVHQSSAKRKKVLNHICIKWHLCRFHKYSLAFCLKDSMKHIYNVYVNLWHRSLSKQCTCNW